MSEIRLRAVAQIGKLSRELDKGRPGPDGKITASGGQQLDKAEQLEAAGLTVRTASRYEELAAPSEQFAAAFESATDNYFAKASEEKTQPTFNGLAKAIRGSLIAADLIVPLPQRTKRKEAARDTSWLTFYGAVKTLAETPEWNWPLICERMAGDTPLAKRAIVTINKYLAEMKKKPE